ncbi:glycosyltransferase family 4 protein [Chengkuizengella sp. SCS-71B]|uniref:glycosyltransferase family 4 protein n=1 Tax=Chengkuizengella sp. SCS-71B TaxID=3115290 RepID=UPI0032C22FE6
MIIYMAGIFAFIFTLIATPIVIKGAYRYGFIAEPRKDRWSQKPTALLGGIAIFISFLIVVLLFNRDWNPLHIGIIVGAVIIFIVGLKDDIKPLRPKMKFWLQMIVAVATVAVGLKIETNLGFMIDSIISIVWIVGIMNAVNLIDNIDGLSSGIAFIASITAAIFLFIAGNPFFSIVTLSLAGAALAFLLFNFKPAKIFMGDCGSLMLGYILGTSTIAIQGTLGLSSGMMNAFYIPALILAVPIFDTFFVAVERKRHGRAISQGGKDHTSHRLVYITGSDVKSVVILYVLGAFFGSISLIGYFNPGIIQYISIGLAMMLGVLLAIILVKYAPVYENKEEKMAGAVSLD